MREVQEETGYTIIPGPELYSARFTDNTHDLLFHYFEPSQYTGEFVRSKDHSDHGWFTIPEIQELELHPSVSECLKIMEI